MQKLSTGQVGDMTPTQIHTPLLTLPDIMTTRFTCSHTFITFQRVEFSSYLLILAKQCINSNHSQASLVMPAVTWKLGVHSPCAIYLLSVPLILFNFNSYKFKFKSDRQMYDWKRFNDK